VERSYDNRWHAGNIKTVETVGANL